MATSWSDGESGADASTQINKHIGAESTCSDAELVVLSLGAQDRVGNHSRNDTSTITTTTATQGPTTTASTPPPPPTAAAAAAAMPNSSKMTDGSFVVAEIVSQVLDDSDQLGLAYLHQ